MNIIVCIKQVPDTHEVKINPETNTIIREGVKAIINPFDIYAVEESLKIREKYGGKITALSMGIPNTARTLKEVLRMGVDEAVLLSDRAFAGADTLATAYTLSLAIKKISDYDLIICGKQATDGDTAQVGPSLAEKLSIPHVTYVSKIHKIEKNFVRLKRLVDDCYELLEVSLPAVITVEKEINVPRLPSLKTFKMAQKKEVKIWNAKDVQVDEKLTGLNGSPTQVIKTFVPNYNKSIEMIEGTPKEQSKKLVDKLMTGEFPF